MIIHIKKDANEDVVQRLVQEYQAFDFQGADARVVVTSSSLKELPVAFDSIVEKTFCFPSDIQLASRGYCDRRTVSLGTVCVGGETNQTVLIAGPCSIESKEQIQIVAKKMKESGVKILRAGCYKPRTSPYSFQGMGLEGLKLLAEVGHQYGLSVITEVRDSTHVKEVIEYSDIIQIGAKAMYDHGILNACSKTKKPVLLKRGFGTTLQELVQAAEFILSGGNSNVILCERGLRTFETKTRFTLDLCGVAYLKEHVNLPVILDPSHAMGYAYGVPDLARACVAMGVDGLLIEVHPNPSVAKSDASQQLDFEQFDALRESLIPVASAVGKVLV